MCHVPNPAVGARKEEGISPDPTSDLESLSHTAFEELETIRTTIDGLRSKVSALEGILVLALGKVKEEGGRRYSFGEQDSQSPMFYLPEAPWTSEDIYVEPGVVGGGAGGGYGETERLGDERGRGEERDFLVVTSRGASQKGEDLRGEEVEASIALEFLALGRNRTLGRAGAAVPDESASNLLHFGSPLEHLATIHGTLFDSSPVPPNPTFEFPTTASLAAVIPPFAQTQAIVSHSLDYVSWYHACVHAPSFHDEVALFWAQGEDRVDHFNPAWLALFFAQMSAGVKHMTPDDQARLIGLTEDESALLCKTHFNAAVACLHRSNFLESHSLYALQAVVVLVLTGQDAGSSNLFPTLLASAIAIAQDMGFQRLSDEAWRVANAGASPIARGRALVQHEMKKRVFWMLTAQDWFSIPFSRKSVVTPSQVTTPVPANATDEDLLTGVVTNRDLSEYTVVGNLLVWIRIARCLHDVFEHIDHNKNPSYPFLLDQDTRLQDIITNVPAWMREGGPTDGMPPCADLLRTSFRISSAHKVVTLHRPFFHLSFRDTRYQSSRVRVLAASRSILHEAARLTTIPLGLWTIPYHISAAASVVCLDLFQHASSESVLNEERHEVEMALATLRRLASPIATRGVALIASLLEEETRFRVNVGGSRRKRKNVKEREEASGGGGGQDFSRAAKRLSLDNSAELAAQDAGPSSSSSLSRLIHPHHRIDDTSTSPLSAFSPTLSSPPAAFHFSPLPLMTGTSGETYPSASPTHWGSPQAPSLFDFGGLPGDSLPPEFLSVFLGSGFDPLDGAITSPTQAQWLSAAGVEEDAYDPTAPRAGSLFLSS